MQALSCFPVFLRCALHSVALLKLVDIFHSWKGFFRGLYLSISADIEFWGVLIWPVFANIGPVFLFVAFGLLEGLLKGLIEDLFSLFASISSFSFRISFSVFLINSNFLSSCFSALLSLLV